MPAVTETKQGQDMVIMVKVQKLPYACINQGRLTAEDSRAGRLSVWYHTCLKALWPVFEGREAANKDQSSLRSPLRKGDGSTKLPVRQH